LIKVYTDGSCLGNPGNGGWAYLILVNNSKKEGYGSEKNTTNNIMELTASIKALEQLNNVNENIIIYTDSNYVKNGITSWINKWKANGWLTTNRKKVKNKELWKALDALTNTLKIEWFWVKAHHTDENNNYVDRMARKAAAEI